MEELTNKIHEIQTEMLAKIHEVCKENNIRYIVICGSLLGAIRHKGFIPWDDDVDIGLMREDYDKLMKILKEKPIKGCFLQNYETDEHYNQPYAKLLREDSAYLEEYRKNCKARHGVFVDIFPLDHIKRPGQKSAQIRRAMAKLVMFAIWRKEDCQIKRKGAKKLYNVFAAMLSILPKKTLVCMQRRLVVRNKPKWGYYASMFSSNYETDRLYFEAKDFDEIIELPFETIMVNAPKNWQEQLTRLYRDYMQLPPPEKRVLKHGAIELRFPEKSLLD